MRVGVLGGGQLGLMLSEAAAELDIDLVLVDPSTDLPPLPHGERVATAFDDPLVFQVLSGCDVVTVELESVPVGVLDRLSGVTNVAPPARAVAVSQDRLMEKDHFTAIGIPTVPYTRVEDAPRRADHDVIVKSRRGGYDGRGQVVVRAGGEVTGVDAIVEDRIDFDREVSIVAARGGDGAVACYPLVENLHSDGILRRTIAPAPSTSSALQALAERHAHVLAESLDYIGVLALELFQVGDDLLANEFAPRVHNTGHWTIEGAATSQFVQHLRAITGQTLGPVGPVIPCTMTNLIGELPEPLPPGHAHLYGKAPRPGRKLGHVTTLG
ncbi:MAG TPA: 5-(carboxyamino)imidazole ribonucleotide synthase [Acidimicrobiales bacterium]|nr:5-(carboxyamino)imidazole ribonucleotide synthase [Acidimicrobiales bacterium]